VRSVDCDNGGRCVTVDGVAVCQTQAESACGANQTCPTGLVCRTVDNTCRTACSPTNDTSCVAGQTCNGTVCLENREVANPGSDAGAGAVDGAAVPDAAAGPDAGAASPDLPVAQPDAAAPDVPLATSDAASADVSLAKPDAAADAPADSGMAADTSGGAKPDTSPSNVCTPPCTVGQACVAGQCEACGHAAGQACCDDTPPCNANLTCTAAKRCACGDQDQACCGGSTCNVQLKCQTGTCTCGDFGYACCAGATCNGGGVCAGLRCGCVKSCEDGFYWKIDDTFHGGFSITNADGSTLVKAPSLAIGYNSGDACVVAVDGTVWCQGYNDKGQLGAGNTSLASSAKLVQVVTGAAPSGTPLTGIKKVAHGSSHVCALSVAGGVWCWGFGANGELGTGNKLSSSFAVPVLDAPAGAPLADASDLAVGGSYACVLKLDGSVWCWGYNSSGALGTGAASGGGTGYPSPAKVVGLTDPVLVLSAGPNSNARTCAIDNKKSVWCWGSGVGPEGTTGNNLSPVRLVMAKNGAAFTDAVQVDASNLRVRKSDGSLWQWSDTATTSVTENNIPVAGSFWLGRGCWIGSDGALRGITNPTCP